MTAELYIDDKHPLLGYEGVELPQEHFYRLVVFLFKEKQKKQKSIWL